ncbi:hypothetical protein GCM10020258_15850 [Sphingomonas yabuuchiae]
MACIGPERADLVVAGCAILETILDLWPAERLGIADRGIARNPAPLDGNRQNVSRGNAGLHQRVRTARKRTAQSTRWLERQLNDPYVRRAKAEGIAAARPIS